MQVNPGTRLGPYEILSHIGTGGMGEVYKARDTRLDRSVAIKILPSEFSENASLKQRFEREARTISQLNHPHICTLHDVGQHDGISYLVMELVEGESLADRLANKGPLPLPEVVRYGSQIAEALDRAHRAGVVHRDLKPGNIMLTRSGAKLLDFGLAKSATIDVGAEGATVHKPLTTEGMILGTFQYMAPEQLEGQEADARTDLFALGAVLYEMASGQRAFEAKSKTSLIAAIVSGEPKPLSQIQPLTPPAFEHVVKKCLEKDPEERWQSAKDVAEELRWIAGSSAGTARIERDARLRISVVALCLFVLLLLGLITWLVARGGGRVEPSMALSIVPPPDRSFYHPMAISPDGQQVALSAIDATGVPSLWLRSLESTEVKPLRGTEGSRYPFWSPDGKWIGYFQKGRLKRMNLSSGAVETICSTGVGGGASWNENGIILFAHDLESDLFRVPAGGGNPVRWRERSDDAIAHLWPHFLPGGRHFLFLVLIGKQPGIYAGTLESGEMKRVIPYETILQSSTVSYGVGHLFAVERGSLMAYRFNLGRLEVTGEPVRVAEGIEVTGPGRAVFSVAPNGPIAYRSAGHLGSSQLTWMDLQGRELGTVGQPGAYAGIVSDVADYWHRLLSLSPDGRTVAITRATGVDPPAVWLIDLERGISVPFTSGAWAAHPVWSPDGTELVYAQAKNTPPNLYIRNVTGVEGERHLMNSPHQMSPTDWPREPGGIIFNRHTTEQGWGLYWIPDLDQPKPRMLIDTEYDERTGRVSPDGKWITFVSDSSGASEIYVASFPEPRDMIRISSGGGASPRWSPSGREIFYIEPATGSLMRVGMSFTPTARATIASALFSVRENGFVFSPDGKLLLVNKIVSQPVSAPVTVLLNWKPR